MTALNVLFAVFALGPFATALFLGLLYGKIRRKAIPIQTIGNIVCSLCGILAHHLSNGEAPDFVRDMVFGSTVIVYIVSWIALRIAMSDYGDKLGLAGTVAAVATVILQLVAASIWM